MATMQHLSHLFLLLLALLPLATSDDHPTVVCGARPHHYTMTKSTYQANLTVLTAVLPPTKTSYLTGRYTYRAVRCYLDGVSSVSHCHNGTSSISCVSCVKKAFQEAQKVCPYRHDVAVFHGDCSLHLHECYFYNMTMFTSGYEGSVLGIIFSSGMALQAMGFAWLLFLWLQEWRDSRKRRSILGSSPLPSGDQ